MRITAIRDIVSPINSAIANAYIDFSKMTASVVAIRSDLIRDGQPVVGFGFNSNGRYAVQGLLRERFIPRLAEAEPKALLDDAGLIDPAKAWAIMMRNEKPGGHGERSVAVGVIDMALWDLRAKAEESRCGACSPTAIGPRILTTRPIRTPGSTPPAAITTPARASRRCRTRCGTTAISVMPASR